MTYNHFVKYTNDSTMWNGTGGDYNVWNASNGPHQNWHNITLLFGDFIIPSCTIWYCLDKSQNSYAEAAARNEFWWR